jgi:hypothetical protein
MKKYEKWEAFFWPSSLISENFITGITFDL